MLIEIVIGVVVAGGLLLWGRSKLYSMGASARQAAPVNQAYLEDFIRISIVAARDVLARNQGAADDELVGSILSAFRTCGYAPKTLLELSIRGMLSEIKEGVQVLNLLTPKRPDALLQTVMLRSFDFDPGQFNPDLFFSAYPLKTPEIRHQHVFELMALDAESRLLALRRGKIQHAMELGLHAWVIGAVVSFAVASVKQKFPRANMAEIAKAASQTAAEELRGIGFNSDVEKLSEMIEKRMLT